MAEARPSEGVELAAGDGHGGVPIPAGDGSPAALKDRLSPIRAVERVCDIFDLLQEMPEGLSLSAIAARTGLPKTSAYRYLVALEAHRYVERDDTTNTIRLGLAFRQKPSHRLEQFVARSIPVLEQLRDVTNETVNLGVIDGGKWIHAAVLESNQMMRLAARVGERAMLHSTGIGKVIAAQLSDDKVRGILESEGMPPITSETITTVDSYFVEIRRVRRRGYAVDDGENQDGGRCVAVPVPGAPMPLGISISAPAERLPKHRVPEIRDLLLEAANKLSVVESSQLG